MKKCKQKVHFKTFATCIVFVCMLLNGNGSVKQNSLKPNHTNMNFVMRTTNHRHHVSTTTNTRQNIDQQKKHTHTFFESFNSLTH